MRKIKILVMGLPGSGKTTLATQIAESLGASYFNADTVRKQFNDWDFSDEARIRQAHRMKTLCEMSFSSSVDCSVADFVCPTHETRNVFAADYTVWLDTINCGRFEDTNRVFEKPAISDYTVKKWCATEDTVRAIIADIRSKYV